MSASIITPLWYANTFVDSVQDAKKKAVETFVFDEKYSKPMKEFIEVQREFVKTANRTTNEVFNQVLETTKGALEQVTKLASKK